MAYEVEAVVTEGVRTRQRILQTALELFRAEGFDGATLRQLADRLELTPAALYYHFASKADILHGVVAPLLDELDHLLGDDSGSADSAADRRLLERLIDVLLDHREIAVLLASDVSAARMSGVRERLEAQNTKLVDTLAGDDRSPVHMVRITAALGALRRPLMDLRHLDLADHRGTILESATAALNPPARRRKGATT